MPSFDDIEVTIHNQTTNEDIVCTTSIDFEVYCGTCGKGLCYESDTRLSKNRNYPQVVVNACPRCIEDKDMDIEKYKDGYEKLLDENYDLKEEIEELKKEISELAVK
jgi:hypothetical protein